MGSLTTEAHINQTKREEQIKAEIQVQNTDLKTEQVLFFFLPQKICGNSAKLLWKSFVISMGVQGCLLFNISAMILVALQNNSLIDVLSYATESIACMFN